MTDNSIFEGFDKPRKKRRKKSKTISVMDCVSHNPSSGIINYNYYRRD